MTDLRDILEQIAKDKNYVFVYGRKDFQNLTESDGPEDNRKYLFVDPIERSPNYSDTGSLVSRDYKGRMMLLYKSDFDKLYDGNDDCLESAKFQKYIKPLLEEVDNDFRASLVCDFELTVDWDLKEVINIFSDNFDGILINYKINQL